MARLVPGTGNFQKVRQPESYLAVDKHVSSFYKLPAVLRWFSSNIGIHHVHHLSPRIPNYHLKKCYDAVPAPQAKVPLSMVKSLSCIQLKMWDEERQKMVAFP